MVTTLDTISEVLHGRPCLKQPKRCLDTKNPRLNQMCDECAGYWLIMQASARLREALALEREPK